MKRLLDAQFQNLFLWAPLLMAFGAVFYFAHPIEPNIAYPALIAILSGSIMIFRQNGIIATAMLLLLFGFCYATAFTRFIDTPVILHTIRNIDITGIVKNIEHTNDKPRIFINVPANLINKNLSEDRSAIIRLSLSADKAPPEIGDTLEANVTLFRPDGAYAPDSFDYARWAYFNGISATGYMNSYRKHSTTDRIVFDINSIRDYIHTRTNSFLSDALVLGYKNAVPADEGSVWTATGIGHVWSISGFHMTLVSAWLFAFFYTIFRSISHITKRVPARYPAMIFAWFGLLFYLFLSGCDVATVRAFFMTSFIFAAFLIGRNPISMRNACIAFMIIFLINPHYVMQPGFQLSFAAIFGLIWYFDKTKYRYISFRDKILNIIKAACATSIIATIFTMPFVAHHFHYIPVYGLIGNLILLPVFSFLIMPLVILGTISTLLGYSDPLSWSANIYDWALDIAHKISELPISSIQTPHIPLFALLLLIMGFLCLIFIKNTNRNFIFRHANIFLFLIFSIFGIFLIAKKTPPLFYASYNHELVAFSERGKLEFNKSRASNHYFAFDTWKSMNHEEIGTLNPRRKCPDGVCIYKTPNWTLAYIQKYVPLSKNLAKLCLDKNIDYIVSYFKIEAPKCDSKILRGGFVIYENGTVKYVPHNRHWHGNTD